MRDERKKVWEKVIGLRFGGLFVGDGMELRFLCVESRDGGGGGV